jgi:hypothetical protein
VKRNPGSAQATANRNDMRVPKTSVDGVGDDHKPMMPRPRASTRVGLRRSCRRPPACSLVLHSVPEPHVQPECACATASCARPRPAAPP